MLVKVERPGEAVVNRIIAAVNGFRKCQRLICSRGPMQQPIAG
jgi:hypothetical protein